MPRKLDDTKIEILFQKLRVTVLKHDVKDRFCILLIDEHGVKPKNVPKNVQGEILPTHVINFMLRGIWGPWKMPISNVFWKRQCADKGNVLGDAIRQIIKKIHTTGLTVIATVSDLSKIMLAAINYLTEDKQNGIYMVEHTTVYHIYDPCKLLMSVRNNLIKNDLSYEVDSKKYIASWSHVTKVYEIDCRREKNQIKLHKLTPQHIYPEFVDKLTTHYCTQVFSESVCKEIKRTVELKQMDSSALDTAKLLLFFDQLFDSCNGLLPYAPITKIYRCSIASNNPHFKLWEQAEKILETMCFVISDTNKIYRPDCLDLWTVSINNMKNVAKLLKKYKVKYCPARYFNLDALTNLIQILRVMNNDPAMIYAEQTDGYILDQNILKMVLEDDEGYFEIDTQVE